jgi:hypothetical protein
VRHILPIYPLLAIAGGLVCASALKRPMKFWLTAPVAMVFLGGLVESALAHPDYLAYVNFTAGNAPERIFGESDLDWGQDLGRLTHRLKELRVNHVAIAYFGSVVDLAGAGLPEYHELQPYERATGWVAVSVYHLTVSASHDGSYAWLKSHIPFERVGRSIFLYRIN